MVLTQERVYFQPALGVISIETTPQAKSWLHSRDLVATARRYCGLKDSGLELFWNEGTSSLFGFERKHDREQVLRLLPTVRTNGYAIPCHTDREFIIQASKEWQSKAISNYEYLLLLNSAAGRTTRDLSRYVIMPWIIADYTSPKLDLTKEETYRDLTKPIGALNEQRLEYFKQRFESMADMEDPFLYGTHYSASGYVLYYLIRSMPEHMLCLQNGKFDAPDRMFHSINQCYSCVLSNHADVKELIPEFFNPNDFDFLINARGLQLGATQNGDRVNDVALPPWAKSPRDFLRKNAKALESDICTSMLPRWIDLIFGCRSRGEAAKEANNLFHRSAYLGPDDLSAMATPEERFQAELQATEFGIVPDQLFVGPHPLRHETVDESFVNHDVGRTFSGTDDGKADAWELLETPSAGDNDFPQGHSGGGDDPATAPQETFDSSEDAYRPPAPSNVFNNNPFHAGSNNRNNDTKSSLKERVSIPMSGSGDIAAAAAAGGASFSYLGKEPTLSNVSSFSGAQDKGSSPTSANDPISPTRPIPATSAEWDVKFIEKSQIHDDAISGCAIFPVDGEKSMLVTTSLDGGLKVHTIDFGLSGTEKKLPEGGITGTLSRFSYITMSRGQVSPANQTKLTQVRSHTSRDPLACLSVAGDNQGGRIAFAGGHDDVVLAYGINSACAVASVYSHRDAVTGLDMITRPPATTQSALWSKKSTHIMVSGSWDATIKVWSVVVANGETVSIDREPLAELFDADSSIVCVSAAAIPDGDGGIVVGAGSADGSFCVWHLHGDGIQAVIHKEPARRGSGPCSVVKWSSEGGRLNMFTGFATGKVASYALADGALRKASAASVGVAVQSMVYSEGILLIGCSDGGLRLIPIRDGAYFSSDLSLWPSVNNKSSPGITSVNLSIIGMANDGSGKCICCTGAEDGSIAIFELKRAVRA
jgi:factor associated with neutral sphingomyelinase activation